MNAGHIVTLLLDSEELRRFVDTALGFGSVLVLNTLSHQDNWGPKYYTKTIPVGPEGIFGIAYFNAHDTDPKTKEAILRVNFQPSMSTVSARSGLEVDCFLNMRNSANRLAVVNGLREAIAKFEELQKAGRTADIGARVVHAVREIVSALRVAIEPAVTFDRI